MAKILVIDNNIDLSSHGCADIERCLVEANGRKPLADFSVEVCRGPEQKYDPDWTQYSGVVISGSKTRIAETHDWVIQQMNFIKGLFEAKIPTFGICYGEQIIMRALFGDSFVGRSPIGEFGLIKVISHPEVNASPYFKGLPESYYSFCYHYDHVERLGEGFRLLGHSELCGIHAYDHLTAPMWGVQYHPEKNLQECLQSIKEIQNSDSSVNISNDAATENLYNSAVGDTLFTNFVEQVGIYVGKQG